MTETQLPLRPVSADALVDILSAALRYDGRRRVDDASVVMARITADYLVSHLQQSGFVLLRMMPASAPTTAIMPSSIG